MSARRPAVLVGSGELAQSILRCRTLLAGLRIASWCPSAAPDPAVSFVGPDLDLEPSSSAGALVEDARFSAVLMVDEAARSTELILAGLAAGKGVLCLPGSDLDASTLDRISQAERRSGGSLACLGLLAHTVAAAQGVKAIERGELGPVRSAYLAIRAARLLGNPRSILEEFGWEALEFLTRVLAGPVESVYASGGALFASGAPDTAVLILRTEAGCVGTIELSRCLPGTWPTAHPCEVEIEVVGADETLRIMPFQSLTIAGDRGVQARPLLDTPLVAILDTFSRTTGSELARHRMIADVLAAARSSLASGQPTMLRDGRPVARLP